MGKKIAVYSSYWSKTATELFVAGVNERAKKDGINVVNLHDLNPVEGANELDGVIMFLGGDVDILSLERFVASLRASDIPFVTSGVQFSSFDFIGADSYGGIRELTEYLISELGLSEFNFLTGPFYDKENKEKLNAFIDTLIEYEMKFDHANIIKGNNSYDDGVAVANCYLNGELPTPEAVVCASDEMAAGLLDTINTLTVTGFGNFSELSADDLAFSTASFPARRLGWLCADYVFKKASGLSVEPTERLSCEVIIK